MKIEYRYVTGEVVRIDVEVSPELADEMKRLDREEWRINRGYYRHACSYDAKAYEGEDYGREDMYFAEEERREMERRIEQLSDLLTPVQRRRVLKLVGGMKINAIAASEGVKKDAVYDSLNAVRKKFQKFLENTPKKAL